MPAPSRPRGLNHLVINVRDLEETHRFWTEMLGFQQVGEFDREDPSGLRRRTQFYSADHGNGRLTHHDIACCEVPGLPAPGPDGTLVSAIGHIAIAFQNRKARLHEIAYLQASGVRFEHGMTHRLHIRDPNGYSVELLYELPRELWEKDINAALNRYVALPTEGAAALEDRTEGLPMFVGRVESIAPRAGALTVSPPHEAERALVPQQL